MDEIIRNIDKSIIKLIEKRIEFIKKLAVEKENIKTNDKSLFELLYQTSLNPIRIEKIFKEIEKLSLEERNKALGFTKTVAILGPEGSFSEEMALKLVGSRFPLYYCTTTNEIIELVENGSVDYGIVPIENSTNGTVFPVLDALLNHNVKVFGEAKLKINQCLVAKKNMDLKEIKTVYSHPQGIAQCMNFIKNYLSHVEVKYTTSTADGIKLLDGESAVIMSENGANYHRLRILRRNIQDLKGENITRFYAIKRTSEEKNGNTTALFFGVEDRPGSLKDVLEIFYSNGFNLRKLESRPARTKLGEYIFFVEVEAPLSEEELKKIRKVTTFHKIIGVFNEIEELDV